MRIALATCADIPDLTTGDQILAREFEKRGAQVRPVIWTDPESLNADCDLLLVRSVWDYHKHLPHFLNWIHAASKKRKVLNHPAVIRRNCDKAYLIEMQKQKVPCPPSVLLPKDLSIEKCLAEVRSVHKGEIVLKPTISATAYLTFRSDAEDNDLASQIQMIQKHSDVLVQKYISSVATEGEVSLIYFKIPKLEFSHAVLKKPNAGDYRVQSDFGGSEELIVPSERLRDLSEKILAKIEGEWIFARVDWIDWSTDPLLGEVEMIEPNLFMHIEPRAAVRFVELVCKSTFLRSVRTAQMS